MRLGHPADHVDRQGVDVGPRRANHLEGSGDLRLAEAALEVDHAGDADGGRELIDGIGRHAGSVGDDEDSAALAGCPQLWLGAEERDVEVVTLAAEYQNVTTFFALAAQEDVGQRVVLEVGLGDAVVDLGEQEGAGSRQLLSGHPPNRFSFAGLVVARSVASSAVLAVGEIHTCTIAPARTPVERGSVAGRRANSGGLPPGAMSAFRGREGGAAGEFHRCRLRALAIRTHTPPRPSTELRPELGVTNPWRRLTTPGASRRYLALTAESAYLVQRDSVYGNC